MAENIDISVSKNGQCEQYKTSSFLLIYLKNEEFRFAGTLELKALAPILMKIMMEKIAK